MKIFIMRFFPTSYHFISLKVNSVALVRKQTILTERPPHVGEVSANFLLIEGVTWSAQRIPTAVNLGFLDPDFIPLSYKYSLPHPLLK
jgi:hypothetical protein